MAAGIVLTKKVGAKIKQNEVLAYVHTNKDLLAVSPIVDQVTNAFVISAHYVAKPQVILEIIGL